MPSLRTNRRTDPANSGLFVLFQEISGSIRFPASQTESFSVPVIAMSRPSSTRRLGEVGQLDGKQLAVPAGIFRDRVSARASARRLASERFPHLDCRHLLRPSSFAAALAYPVRSPTRVSQGSN